MKRIISVLLITILIFSGCGILPSPDNTYFSYYLSSNVKSLDPQTELCESAPMVLTSLFEGLCTLDENNKPKSAVASAWFSNADNTEYVFILRSDAYWSNGTQVTANDFVFAIQRGLMKETYSQYTEELFNIKNARNIYNGEQANLGVEAKSDTILKFTLENSDPNFAYTVCTEVFYPCNEEFFNSTSGRYGLTAEYLISNGAFKFTNKYAWSSGEYIELVPNPKYWNKSKTTAEKLTYYMKDKNDLLEDPISSLMSKKLDIAEISSNEVDTAIQNGLNIESYYTGTTGLIFSENSDLPVEMREIFVKSINRETLISNIPVNKEPYGDIVPIDILYGNKSYRELSQTDMYIKESNNISTLVTLALESLEWEEIPAITVICLDDEDSINIANSIITMWNQNIGAYFNILPLSKSDYQNRISSGNYDVALTTLSSIGTTATSYLSQFTSTNSNLYLDSVKYDNLFLNSNGSIDDLNKIESYILDNYYFYPIYSNKTYYAVAPEVSNAVIYINKIDFSKISKR